MPSISCPVNRISKTKPPADAVVSNVLEPRGRRLFFDLEQPLLGQTVTGDHLRCAGLSELDFRRKRPRRRERGLVDWYARRRQDKVQGKRRTRGTRGARGTCSCSRNRELHASGAIRIDGVRSGQLQIALRGGSRGGSWRGRGR